MTTPVVIGGVVAGTATARTDLTAYLADLVGSPTSGWRIRVDDSWAHAEPPPGSPAHPGQGWKLHISATESSAAAVLHACATILVPAECAFKVARDVDVVKSITSAHSERESAGKVITVYPPDSDTAVFLATQLDLATRGLRGPRVLTDRPFAPGSLVHYRYGAFTGIPVLTHDGTIESAVLAPDGTLVPDQRVPGGGAGTEWPNPFTASSAEARSTADPVVLIGGRFAVYEALRHATRGGVYRASQVAPQGESPRESDGPSPPEVIVEAIVKQARSHIGEQEDGFDVTDRLRHEADVLRVLGGRAHTPRLYDFIEQGGDVFLVEEMLPGRTLRSWVGDDVVTGVVGQTRSRVTQLLLQVVDILVQVRDLGLVLRDLSPNNVLVDQEDRVHLVDLELARFTTDRTPDVALKAGTAAYAAPEQLSGAAADPRMDLFALGALILFCYTGYDPVPFGHAEGVPPPPTRQWLDHPYCQGGLPDELRELTLDLVSSDPERRPGLDSVRKALEALCAATPAAGNAYLPPAARRGSAAVAAPLQQLDPTEADNAITMLVDKLLVDIHPSGERVAHVSPFGRTTAPTNVQHGAAGLLGVLLQAAQHLPDPRILEKAAATARWLDVAISSQPTWGVSQGPVGLHFGISGTCWALAEAGATLGEQRWVDHAVNRLIQAPTDWPGPDVTHGIAGLGLTALRVGELTGDPRIDALARAVVARLAATGERDEHGLTWRTPLSARSAFAGTRHLGFAHGTAGICTFLLGAARRLGDDHAEELAYEAGAGLLRAGMRTNGFIAWGSTPEMPQPTMPHWCNGTSGVLTSLVRLDPARLAEAAHHTPDHVAALVAEGSTGILADRWRSSATYCHGLAGDADLLIDVAECTERTLHRAQAADLLARMWASRRADIDGREAPAEAGRRVVPDFGVGYSGALSTLLRYRFGGGRIWLPGVLS